MVTKNNLRFDVCRQFGDGARPVEVLQAAAARDHGVRGQSVLLGPLVLRHQPADDRVEVLVPALGVRRHPLRLLPLLFLRKRRWIASQHGRHHRQQVRNPVFFLLIKSLL